MPRAERSDDDDGLTPAERELEDALRGLNPTAARIDRDRLLLDAGAAAGRAQFRRVVGPAAGVLAACLAFALLWPAQPTVVERVVLVPAAPAPEAASTQESDKYGVRPSTAPVALASLTPVPFPVPGGPFVTVRLGKMGETAGAIPTGAYLEKIQNVFRNGWGAPPRTLSPADDAGGATDVPPGDASRPG